MGPTLPFCLGLLLLLAHGFLDQSLPHDPSLWRLVLCAPAIAFPALLALLVPRAPRVWRAALIPIGYGVLLLGADLPAYAAVRADGSQTLSLLILVGPLVLAEALLRVAERIAYRRGARGAPPPSVRAPALLLILAPLLVFSCLADLVFGVRGLAVFFLETKLGLTIGMLVMTALICTTLPLFFRFLLPARRLDGSRGAELARAAARDLGFSERSLLVLDTGHREVNAALVGPLPWPRYLVLSDGLLALLASDPPALRGVIAHEIGHARAWHTSIVIACVAIVPILLLEPLRRGLPRIDGDGWQIVWLALAMLLVVGLLRLLAHRFEHEADQLSAEALGSASACISALRRVGDLLPQGHHSRTSLRHPSEDRRVDVLLRCELDARHRARFWRRGRVLRSVIAAILLGSIALAAHAHASSWAADRVRISLLEGRFEAAASQLAALPGEHDDERRALGAEIAAARSLIPSGGDWEAICEPLAEQARVRGEEILARGHDETRAREARPFFALALHAHAPSARTRTLHMYCEAMAARSDADAAELWEHARGLH